MTNENRTARVVYKCKLNGVERMDAIWLQVPLMTREAFFDLEQKIEDTYEKSVDVTEIFIISITPIEGD